MAEFKITQTNYDFTTKRVNAVVQKTENADLIFITINIPFEAPSNAPVKDIEGEIYESIRKALRDASSFTK